MRSRHALPATLGASGAPAEATRRRWRASHRVRRWWTTAASTGAAGAPVLPPPTPAVPPHLKSSLSAPATTTTHQRDATTPAPYARHNSAGAVRHGDGGDGSSKADTDGNGGGRPLPALGARSSSGLVRPGDEEAATHTVQRLVYRPVSLQPWAGLFLPWLPQVGARDTAQVCRATLSVAPRPSQSSRAASVAVPDLGAVQFRTVTRFSCRPVRVCVCVQPEAELRTELLFLLQHLRATTDVSGFGDSWATDDAGGESGEPQAGAGIRAAIKERYVA